MSSSNLATPEVIARTDDLVVLNKPANLSLLADRSGAPCLWEALPDIIQGKPYLVHRLDKGTSGVLVIAKNQQTQTRLTRAFRERRVRKQYLAWVTGNPGLAGTGHIDLPLQKGRKSRYRVAGQRDAITRTGDRWQLRAAAAEGHASFTRLRTAATVGAATASARTLLVLQPATGRTHQLRVHLAWIGHPVLGDGLYGKPDSAAQQAPRLQLHCHRLVLPGYGAFVAQRTTDWLSAQ